MGLFNGEPAFFLSFVRVILNSLHRIAVPTGGDKEKGKFNKDSWPGFIRLSRRYCIAMTFDPNFKLTVFSTRADLGRKLENRCAKTDLGDAPLLWKHAWQRYMFESAHFIKPERCFPISDPKSKQKVLNWRTQYISLTIRHFLPYFQSRLPMLSGRAKKRYENVIEFLEFWKTQIPKPLWENNKKPEDKIILPTRVPPTRLQLPKPPAFPSIKIDRPTATATLDHDLHGMVAELNGDSSDDEILAIFEKGKYKFCS